MDNILLLILATVFLTIVINVFLKKIQIPTIIGYIFSGVFIVNILDLHHVENEFLTHAGEFGIVFLMFTIGLEFSIKHLVSMKREVFLYGFLQVFITGNIVWLLAYNVFHIPLKTSIIIGFALALSSTAIVLKMLNENDEIYSGYGRKSLGILLFQDLAVIPILLMISLFTNDSLSLSELLIQTLIDAVVVLLIMFVIGKFLINRFFTWVTAVESEEIFVIAVLFSVMSASYLAHYFGFAYSLGAFIAGMTIAETRFKYRIEADLIPFRDILLGVFFVSVGMQIDLDSVISFGSMILGLLVSLMVLKMLIIYVVLSFVGGEQRRTALKSALSLAQVGEFSLAIISLASHDKLLSNDMTQVLIVTVVLSMIITPFMIKNIKKLADMMFAEVANDTVINSSGYQNHVIIFGYGSLGQKIAKGLNERGVQYLIVEHASKLVTLGLANNEPIIFANGAQRSTLEAINLKYSVAAVVAISNEEKLRLVCESIGSFNAPINIVVKVTDVKQKELLTELNINHFIVSSDEISDLMVDATLQCKVGI